MINSLYLAEVISRRWCRDNANLRLGYSDNGFWRARPVGLAIPTPPRLAYS